MSSRPKRKRKKIDYGEANLNWIEHQQLVKALTLSLKSDSMKPEDSSETLETNITTRNAKKSSYKPEVDDGESNGENCMVPLTRLQKLLHDTLVRGEDITNEASTSSNLNTSITSDTDSKKSNDLTLPKFRAQRKFAPCDPNVQDVLTKPRPRPYKKKSQKVVMPAKRNRPRNIICDNTPDTSTFLTYLCFRGTKYEPDLDL